MFPFRRPQRERSGTAPHSSSQATPADPKFEAIRERFIARTRDDCAILAGYGRGHPSRTPELISIVHRLAGSAGLLGYADISAVAGRLDDELAEPETNVDATLGELLIVLEKVISTGN